MVGSFNQSKDDVLYIGAIILECACILFLFLFFLSKNSQFKFVIKKTIKDTDYFVREATSLTDFQLFVDIL